MEKFTNPLENIKIASPCAADWNSMIGTERKRFCGACKLNVYNLSGMTQREAENLLLDSEGRLCVRFYRRADGTVLTKDCPVGWQLIKRNVSKTAAAFASLVFTAVSGIGLVNYFTKSEKRQTAETIPPIENLISDDVSIKKSETSVPIQDNQNYFLGQMEIPNDKGYATVGRLTNPPKIRGQIKKQRRR